MGRRISASAGSRAIFCPASARDGRTIFDAALGMFRLHMGESEGTSHSQHGVGDHERPVRVARDPAEAEIGPWLRVSGLFCENAARAAFLTKWAFWYPQSGIRVTADTRLRIPDCDST